MRKFSDFSEQEILALAIANEEEEEEDGGTYADFVQSVKENYPDTAPMFTDMAAE
jgi:hypothetical protein